MTICSRYSNALLVKNLTTAPTLIRQQLGPCPKIIHPTTTVPQINFGAFIEISLDEVVY